MLASNLVMYFIILTTAATLHASGKTDISSAADAASALQPLLGAVGKYLFAIGIIGAGLLAIPVLTGSSGYALSEAFGWRHGLDEKVTRAKGFYAIIIASMIVGMLSNYLGLDPIKALVYSATINGITSPPLLLLIVLLSNRRTVMGKYTEPPVEQHLRLGGLRIDDGRDRRLFRDPIHLRRQTFMAEEGKNPARCDLRDDW